MHRGTTEEILKAICKSMARIRRKYERAKVHAVATIAINSSKLKVQVKGAIMRTQRESEPVLQ